MRTEIAERKDEIAAIRRRCRASCLETFGSAARGTDFDPETANGSDPAAAKKRT
ncbi:MAG: hypothetical protein OYG32_14780 [Rhodospirillaceae bacterium]|nr:hypothetical protein [Rhodospirillaceae bacterium]